jgi:hypothetical protein
MPWCSWTPTGTGTGGGPGRAGNPYYRELLVRSVLLSGLLEREIPGEVLICDATYRHGPEPVGEDFICVRCPGRSRFVIMARTSM